MNFINTTYSMLPRGSLENSSHGEFSRFALKDKEKLFVLTYMIYILNTSRTCPSTDGMEVRLTDTEVSTVYPLYPLSNLMITDDDR
jgi:hypothetical protein